MIVKLSFLKCFRFFYYYTQTTVTTIEMNNFSFCETFFKFKIQNKSRNTCVEIAFKKFKTRSSLFIVHANIYNIQTLYRYRILLVRKCKSYSDEVLFYFVSYSNDSLICIYLLLFYFVFQIFINGQEKKFNNKNTNFF